MFPTPSVAVRPAAWPASTVDSAPIIAPTTLVWPLTGRGTDLARLREDITAGRNVVVSGPAGMGKSRLLDEALAGHGSGAVLRISATAAAAVSPLGAFCRLLPVETPAANLLGWAVQGVLAHAQEGRLTLAVDDMHLLDATSAALVHQLVHGGGCRLVGTFQLGAEVPDAVAALWKDGLVERMELSPLAETDIGELARAALGGPVAPQTVRRLWSLSEGLPLLLRELVLGALAEGTFGVHDGRWHWRGPAPTNPRLAELIEARLGRLDAEEQRALELVALGEPLELPVLVALAGAPLAESLEQKALIRERRSGRRLDAVLAHPLYGEMVRAATPPLRRRRLYEELANAVSAHGWRRREDYLRVALWRLEAGVGEQPDRLLAAFRVARSANDEVLAERLARTALAAGGGARAAVALADVLQAGGRWDEAAAVIRSAWDEPVDGPVRAELAIRLAWTIGYGEGDLARGTAVIDEVEQQVTDADARDALENQRIGFLCDAGRVVAAVERCADLLDRPSLGVEHRADTQSMLAFGLAAMGRTVQAAELAQRCWEERERWRPAAAFVVWQLGKARTLAALYAGDLDAADAALDWQLAEHSDDHAFARRAVQWQRGYALRLRGRIATAANEATPEAGAEGFVGAFGLAEAAHSAALFGDLVRARSLRSRVTVQPAWSWCGRFSALAADAWIAAQAGLLTEAIRLGQQLAEDSRQAGMVGEEMFALHHLVRLNAAGVAVERLAEIATVHDGPLAAAIAAHARAVAAADASALLEAADRFERLGMMLFAAEAAAQAGRAWHTDRRSRPATAAAGRALRLAERCEGARTPALVGLNVPELSRREYEVARLAADGRSNKEIATHLYIVERTVENHLRSIFIKTGITRREHLGDLFS